MNSICLKYNPSWSSIRFSTLSSLWSLVSSLNRLITQIAFTTHIALFDWPGLPIWYFTTTTYRAPLPFSEIDDVASMLYNSRIEFKFDFEFVHFNSETAKYKLENFDEKFVDEMNKRKS